MFDKPDKFDHLIALAAMQCAKEDAQKFNELDTSEVVFDESYYAERARIIKKCKRTPALKLTKTIVIRLATAIMIMLALVCVLIGCVPRLRQAIYDAIVEWYDDYFAVRYEDPDGKEKETLYEEESTAEIESAEEAPEYIKNVRKPSNLPEGTWEDVVIENNTHISVDYYYGEGYLFSFAQSILNPSESYVDNEEVDVKYITINGNDATVVENKNKREIYIFWNDNEYSYHICSTECDLDALIEYAQSVE